ncbi:hypothetical protein AKO1_005714, partial [Acrasis kona]
TLLLTNRADVNVPDENNVTPFEYVIQHPLFGSFDNSTIIDLMMKHGADVDRVDDQQRTPLYYASLRMDNVLTYSLLNVGMAKFDQKVVESARKDLDKYRTETLHLTEPESVQKHRSVINVDQDADETRERLEEEREKKLKSQKLHFAIDKQVNMAATTEVYSDPTTGELYDIMLQKTQIDWGANGCNNFYKMQILFNPLQPHLYVLWNRWGRVGDQGQHQRTAYSAAEEVVTEFKKIFKSKTKNEWSHRGGDQFVKQPGMYSIVDVRCHIEVDDLLNNIQWDAPEVAQKTVVSDTSLVKAIKKFCDTDLLKKYTTQKCGSAILGDLKKDAVKKGLDLLNKILADIKELNDGVLVEEENKGDAMEVDGEGFNNQEPKRRELNPTERREKFDQLTEKSNQFYTMVPHAEFTNSAFIPITNADQVAKKKAMLAKLLDLQIAKKIIFAAQNRVKDVNPIDYVYFAFNSHFARVQDADPDFEMIRKYISNTSTTARIKSIFRVVRHVEQERYKPFESDKNRMLLWHGSSASNYLSILSSGLRIAPPEAPVSGYMFGKGVYFSDVFKKSESYCHAHMFNGRAYLMLCEVALGDMSNQYNANYMETPQPGTLSTKGLGRNAPDYTKPSFVMYDGVKVPLQEVVQDDTGNYTRKYSLNYNEYIVYNEAQVKIRYLIQVKNGPS